MSVFDVAVNDIFLVEDFIEILTVGNLAVRVSSYVGTTQEAYEEFGADPGREVSITCKCSDWTPARGDKVGFRGKEWRVADFETDSHALCYKVRLKSLESK